MPSLASGSYARHATLVQTAADEFQASVLGPVGGGIRHTAMFAIRRQRIRNRPVKPQATGTREEMPLPFCEA